MRAQDRELTAAEREELDAAKAKGVAPRWHVDFWPAWPSPTDNFADVYLSGATDPLELGYYLDERSISPKRFYGVIVPRFGVVREGRYFLVEVNSRRVVGVLDGPGFAFPKTAGAAWSYHWAPDGASFIIEQADVRDQVWGRRVLQLVELRGGLIAKQNRFAQATRQNTSMVRRQGSSRERAFLAAGADGAALRLAETTPDLIDWWVQREATGGPLQMMERRGSCRHVTGGGRIGRGGQRRTAHDEQRRGARLTALFLFTGSKMVVRQSDHAGR